MGGIEAGSEIQYTDDVGAMLVEANADSLHFQFINISNQVIDRYTIKSGALSAEDRTIKGITYSFQLDQNYPNPFNPSTDLGFHISEYGFVVLRVFDAAGRQIERVSEGWKYPGSCREQFNATGLASGVYLYSITMSGRTQSKKMMLLR